MDSEKSHSSDFVSISEWLAVDKRRNQLIAEDISRLYKEGRNILVIVNRLQQMEELRSLLTDLDSLFFMSGQTKKKERDGILSTINQNGGPFILMSTGKFIDEGFDLPRLDSLVLAAPLSWRNNFIKYAGRIHRAYKGKELVKIVDYLDIHLPYLEKMFQKRQAAYKKMGYQLIEGKDNQNFFMDRTSCNFSVRTLSCHLKF